MVDPDPSKCVALMILAGYPAWPRHCPTCGHGVCPRWPQAHEHLMAKYGHLGEAKRRQAEQAEHLNRAWHEGAD